MKQKDLKCVHGYLCDEMCVFMFGESKCGSEWRRGEKYWSLLSICEKKNEMLLKGLAVRRYE